ncbi:MAG: polysaccharide biosynthesis/export family protein [Pseudomonadota bacterium]
MRFALVFTSLLASGCAALERPGNIEPVAEGASYQAQLRDADGWPEANDPKLAARPGGAASSIALNAERCAPQPAARPAAALYGRPAERLSRGDMVALEVTKDAVFTGRYEISQDGMLRLPHLHPLAAHGLSASALEGRVRAALVAARYYTAPGPAVSVRLADHASARVAVSGAVFEPGTVEIGLPGQTIDTLRQKTLGAATEGRNLSVALTYAGGARPDADLSRVLLTRAGVVSAHDLRGAVTGAPFQDVALLAGDAVHVPSRGCFQEALVKPSAVTRAGVTTFLSNLTTPALSNANSAIGRETRDMAYGTRFSQAVFSMNCVGGAALTNADRYAVLFTRNPMTGRSLVIERRLERLIRRDLRDDYDPFIMPGDALACYDSAVTNLAQVTELVSKTLATAYAVKAHPF